MDSKKSVIDSITGIAYELGASAKDNTTFRIGGRMGILAKPKNIPELIRLIHAAEEFDYPYFVLGNGSNLLISDSGADAMFIRLSGEFCDYRINGSTLFAGGGASLCPASWARINAGLLGHEWAVGIPGTIGGAVAMNAGAYGGETVQVLKRVTLLADGKVITKEVEPGDMGYRHSVFAFPAAVILQSEFELAADDGGAKARMEEYNLRRREKQPLEFPSAGSTFKRPEGHFAGKLIEDAGLKGFRIGGAEVSAKHAGFIVNTGNATFSDVTELIKEVQNRVYELLSVHLEPEIKSMTEESLKLQI